MAAEPVGAMPVRTNRPLGTSIDLITGVIDSTGANFLGIDASGRITVKMTDGAGNALSSTSGALQVDLAQQTLTAVKVSATAAANALGNPLFFQLSDGTNAFGEPTNPFSVEVIVGGAVKGSEAAPFFIEIAEAGATLSAGNPLSVRLTDGTSYNAQASPVFAAVSKNTTINSVTNPIAVQLSDGSVGIGTASNPVFTSEVVAAVGTVKRLVNVGGDVVKQTTTNADFTVPVGKSWELHELELSPGENGHFEVILDATGTPVTIGTYYVAYGNTYYKRYILDTPTLAASQILRIAKSNDGNQDAKFSVTVVVAETP